MFIMYLHHDAGAILSKVVSLQNLYFLINQFAAHVTCKLFVLVNFMFCVNVYHSARSCYVWLHVVSLQNVLFLKMQKQKNKLT